MKKLYEYSISYRNISDIIFPSLKTIIEKNKPFCVRIVSNLDEFLIILSKENFFELRYAL